jgi:phage protein U
VSFATLGPITFEVNADKVRTWQDVKRNGSARWATHEVYAGKPVQEFLGPGLASITMSIRLDINRGVIPRDELRQIREQLDTGNVLPFTVGGEPVGDFVIKSASEDWTRFSGDGVLLCAIVSLSLEEYQ